MEIVRLVEPANLRWLSPGRTWEEDSMQRDFALLGHAKWRDAVAATQREAQLIGAGHRAMPEVDDEDLVPEDIVEWAFQLLDLGVVGAVLALNAAGCRTLYSCRGGEAHAQRHPLVTFRARPFMVPVLIGAAEDSACGLENAEQGGLILYAEDITAFMRFAGSLVGRKADLVKQGKAWHRARQSLRSHARRADDQLDLFSRD